MVSSSTLLVMHDCCCCCIVVVSSAATGPPTLLSLLPMSPSVLFVSWSAPDELLGTNETITSYRVRYRLALDPDDVAEESSAEYDEELAPEDVVWKEVELGSDASGTNLTGLNSFSMYEVSVAAGTSLGRGPESLVVVNRTAEDGEY